MTTQPTAQQVYTVAQPIVDTLLMAMAYAELERAKMDKIYNGILSRCTYYDTEGKRISDHNKAYLMDDNYSATFLAHCTQAVKDAGYNVPEGNCPALMAEHDVVKLEWSLMQATAPLFGIDWQALYGENRAKYLDLTIKLVVNHPFYKNPMKRSA